ncbi:MAG: chemotaxis protein CheW [Proteobacteria bacterium]|nr:chemotaxis protein CheW [Pseudomonadota bacterium]
MAIEGVVETSQYLTFTLDEEVYALDIKQVREVLDFTEITKVPRMPGFMRGVINLRGGVVPVVDLRLKFGLTKTEKKVDTCIIIMELTLDGETTRIGALADSVREVLNLEPDQIEPAPKLGMRLKTDFIKGMGKKNDEFIIILDIDKIFSSDELSIALENEESSYSPGQANETDDDQALRI